MISFLALLPGFVYTYILLLLYYYTRVYNAHGKQKRKYFFGNKLELAVATRFIHTLFYLHAGRPSHRDNHR